MRALIAEIRRRKVHRAAGLYMVGGFATVEAADLLVPLLGLPDWSVRLVFALVLAGFPLAMSLAWVFELTSSGLERTPTRTPEPAPGSGTPAPERAGRPAPDGADRADKTSILVAPVQNESEDADAEFISDGLTDEIITDLSKIPTLRVISRASTMRLKGAGDGIASAARELGVDYVLDGWLRAAGDELRLTLQLIHLPTEESRWSERYTGTLGDLVTIHDDAARSVANALGVELPRSSDGAIRRIQDSRAAEAYLRARYETWKFSREGLEEAERHLRHGLQLVGDDPVLYAALGHAYSWYAQLGLDPDGAYITKAAECADRVFALDPASLRGEWLRAMVRFQSGDLRAARAPLERAVDGSPSDPDALVMLGYLCALSGQHRRALELFERAMDVDPLTPLNQAMPGFVALLDGRPEDAVPHYRRYREMDPQSPFAVWCWAWVLMNAGRITEAEEPVRALQADHPGSLFTALGASAYHALRGETSAAVDSVSDALRAAARSSELFSRELTACYAAAGRKEEALRWLENTIDIGNVNFPFWSQHNRLIEPLRSEPAFEPLMAQVHREWRSLNPELAD